MDFGFQLQSQKYTHFFVVAVAMVSVLARSLPLGTIVDGTSFLLLLCSSHFFSLLPQLPPSNPIPIPDHRHYCKMEDVLTIIMLSLPSSLLIFLGVVVVVANLQPSLPVKLVLVASRVPCTSSPSNRCAASLPNSLSISCDVCVVCY